MYYRSMNKVESLDRIEPDWNVNCFSNSDRILVIADRIEPDWNVNRVFLYSRRLNYGDRIEPDWNVNYISVLLINFASGIE